MPRAVHAEDCWRVSRPACRTPHIHRVYQAARPKPLGEPSPLLGGVTHLMKLFLSSLLLVFLTDKLNQALTWMAWRTTSWWKRCCEGRRGARVVSPFLRVFTGWFCGCWVCIVFVCFVCFWSVLLVKTPAFNYRFTFFCEFLVVDRPCPVLARQCRKKKSSTCTWVNQLATLVQLLG